MVATDGAFRARAEGESIMSDRIQSLALVLAARVLALALGATASADTIHVPSDAGKGSNAVQERAEAA